MALVVRAFPVRDRSGVDAFVRELGDRETEARAFYNELEVRREAWFYQKKADGNGLVIGVTDVAEPIEPKAAQYADATDPFSVWFKAHIYALSGVDPDVAPLGPVSEIVHDTMRGSLPANATLVARAYPLRDREELDKFLAELRARPERDYAEAWFTQNTDEGPIVIAVLADGEISGPPSEKIFEFKA